MWAWFLHFFTTEVVDSIIDHLNNYLSMHAVIFDIDHTIFDANQALREGVVDLLAILQNLGVKVGALSSKDHRALVHLDEAGIRTYFNEVLCGAHAESPKSVESVHRLLQQLGGDLHQAVFVSHAHADILLGKEAGLAKTIGVSHGIKNAVPLHQAGADHIISNIPAVLDVLE